MKTKMNHLVAVAIFALLILGGNVSAKGTEIIASSHESIKEQALVIEDWMLNENNWNNTAYLSLTNEMENSLELENWMITENNWENWFLMEANQNVAEETIELENWMTDQNVWTVQVTQENESKLAMEDWMNNENNWTR
jgi:hypothetical protein